MNTETIEFLMGMNLLQKEIYSIKEVINKEFNQVHEMIGEEIVDKLDENKDFKVAVIALQIKLAGMLPHYLKTLEWIRSRMIDYCTPLRDWEHMITPCPPPETVVPQ